MMRLVVLAAVALFGLTGCVVAPAPYYGGGYYRAPAYGYYGRPYGYGGGYGYGGYRRY